MQAGDAMQGFSSLSVCYTVAALAPDPAHTSGGTTTDFVLVQNTDIPSHNVNTLVDCTLVQCQVVGLVEVWCHSIDCECQGHLRLAGRRAAADKAQDHLLWPPL